MLTVTDNDGVTGTDSMTMTITALPNTPPTADAGQDRSVQVNQPVIITGSGTDTDGTITSYEWKKGNTVLATTASFDYTPDTVGTDTLMLTVTDNSGMQAEDSMIITISTIPPVDTTPPVITLKGTNQMSIGQGSTFLDPGATAADNVDGIVMITESGTVDTSTVGSYTRIYTVTDTVGNTATETRTVNVVASGWYTFENEASMVTYTTTESDSTIELDERVKTDLDITANNYGVVFKEKTPLVIGNCQIVAYVSMKNNGDIVAGYRHDGNGCSNDINEFTPGTTVNVGSDMVLLIETLLTDDLTLGGK